MEAPETDLLYGIKDIARYLGLTPRQAEHRIAKRDLPSFRMGAVICSTKTGLKEHFRRLASGNVDFRGCSGDTRED